MTIFYFTATGNSLAVAKRIGGGNAELRSIPQVVGAWAQNPAADKASKDDVIGIVFPIYGFGLPKMVRRFLNEASLTADYLFAIGTYGCKPGACMRNLQRDAAKNGTHIDYARHLLMVDNYLPGFEIGDQIAKLPKKQVEANLADIITDVAARKPLQAKTNPVWLAATAAIQAGELFMNPKAAQNYLVNDSCTRCGTCAKVCPAGNITVTDNVAFADKCEWCFACLHLCPAGAVHMKNEKSAARWRNPDVTVAEIATANETNKEQ